MGQWHITDNTNRKNPLMRFCAFSLNCVRPRGLTSLFAVGLVIACLHTSFAMPDWNLEVRRLINHRQLAEAERLIVERLVATPRAPDLILLLAEVRFNQQRYEESLHLLDNVRELKESTTAQMSLLRGLNHVALGHLELAESSLREAVRRDPTLASAHYYLGRLLYTWNRFDEAVEEFQVAIRLDPNWPRAYDNLGLCYEAKQEYEAAEQAFLEAIRLVEKQELKLEWPSLNLGTMLLKRNELARAKPHILKALELNSKSAEAHFQQAILHEREGNLEAALRELQRATELETNRAEAYYRAGRIYQRLGKTPQARKQFVAFEQASRTKKKASAKRE